VVQGLEVRGGGVAVAGEPGADLLAQPGQVAVGVSGADHVHEGAGVGGVVVQLEGEQHLPAGLSDGFEHRRKRLTTVAQQLHAVAGYEPAVNLAESERDVLLHHLRALRRLGATRSHGK